MDPLLRRALAPILVDIASTGAPRPRIEEKERNSMGRAAAYLWSPDGSGMGVAVSPHQSEAERLVEVADQVQEWVIEELWRKGSNWPQCPRHPTTHPARPRVGAVSGLPEWTCPADDSRIADIGALNAPHADGRERPPMKG
jgi:hypothetical protein